MSITTTAVSSGATRNGSGRAIRVTPDRALSAPAVVTVIVIC